jgi:hypothetical protein
MSNGWAIRWGGWCSANRHRKLPARGSGRGILCEIGGDLGELIKGGLQVFHYFGGEDGRIGQVVGVFQVFVA